MSEFSVHRTLDTHPALKYCLILDGRRIAGGKPDYRGNNHLISWKTSETYGPGGELEAENAKLRERIDTLHMSRLLTENENESLRELVRLMWKPFCWAQSGCEVCLTDEQDAEIRDKVRDLGVEVEQ